MDAVGIEFQFVRGNSRQRPCLDFPNDKFANVEVNVVEMLHDEEIKAFVNSANLHRRHLTSEEKRKRIADVLKAKPEISNRQIAGIVKADDKTVAEVRTELEATAEIPQLKERTSKDGKVRPARAGKKPVKPKLVPPAKLKIASSNKADPAEEPNETPKVTPVEMTDKQIGELLEQLGPNRFFMALPYAPTIKAEIERRHERHHVVDLGTRANKIVTLALECRAHLKHPMPANIETVSAKLSRIAKYAKSDGPKTPPAEEKKPTLDMDALRRGLRLDEPATQPTPDDGSNFPIPTS